MKTVHVIGNQQSYLEMFEEHGWVPVDTIEDADLVQFCGGPDVWPGLYKEGINQKTRYNLTRDRYERAMWDLALEQGCAIAGICRGAQFVHVMNGGALWQHVNNHANGGSHVARIEVPQLVELAPDGVYVSSTHHQMMKEGCGTVVLSAKLASVKEDAASQVVEVSAYKRDIEAVYHERTNSFCYQPHPEFFTRSNACQILYFQLIKRLLVFNTEDEE